MNRSQKQVREKRETEQLRKEILQLRKSVERRTAELEEKRRELEMEAALERVRARTMAMQKSDELPEASGLLFQQLKELGVTALQNSIAIVNEPGGFVELSTSVHGHPVTHTLQVPVDDPYVMRKAVAAWKAKRVSLKLEFKGRELKNYNAHRNSFFKKKKRFPEDRWVVHIIFFSRGWLSFSTNKDIPSEFQDILERIASVFEQTYTRFLDLQKAEAQVREAQIEAALERIRARALAMHSSEELADVARVMREQMVLLGQPELETSALHLYEEDPESIFSWRAFRLSSDLTGKVNYGFFKIPKNSCAIAREFVKQFRSKATAYTIEVNGARQREWYKILFKLAPEVKAAMEKSGATTEKRFYHFSSFSGGALLMVSSREPSHDAIELQKRAAKVFDLAYRRFKDLQHAEAQSREAQIQLALERVRARTMAMQRSEELPETAALLFEQFRGLGEVLLQMTIGIVQEEKGITELNVTDWAGSGTGISRTVEVSNQEPALISKMITGWKKKKKSVIVDLSGQELKDWLAYRKKVSGVSVRSKDTGGRRVICAAFFSRGFLAFSMPHLPSAESQTLLEKFATVFDLTYTRFLDLQKAEAQAREAEIQLALERVRARSLAMHHTSELQEVINIVAQQLLLMDIDMNGGVFMTVNAEVDKHLPIWAAAGAANYAEKAVVPYLDNPIITSILEAVRKGPGFVELSYTDDIKIAFFRHLFRYPPWKSTSPQWKKELLSKKGGYTRSVAVSRYTSIGMTNHHGLRFTEAENEILRRFGNVLEQSYTRFLDLQKAEAQAREAKIEAALERIRSVSMAIRKSNELMDIIHTVFGEWKKLGLELYECNINLLNREKKEWTNWGTGIGEAALPRSFLFPWFDNPFVNQLYEDTLAGIPFRTFVMEGGNMRRFLDEMFIYTDFRDAPQEYREQLYSIPRLYLTHAYMRYGSMDIVGPESPPEQTVEILKRFAKVFEQAYTRYVDVVQAEVQAREAQIEAALERVRSRSMGMQKSEELRNVVQVIYEQFVHLGIDIFGADFRMDYREREDWHIWTADRINSFPSQLSIPYFDHPYWNAWNDARRKGMDVLAYTMELGEKNSFVLELSKHIPDMSAEGLETVLHTPGYSVSNVFLQHVALSVDRFNTEPFSDADNAILLRFGIVFEQSYTRFKDLEKAEAQAREAQIEAALEKVRSRTLAMQRSDELAGTAAVLFQQLISLGIEPNRLYIILIKEHTADMDAWVTDEDGSKVSMGFTGNSRKNGTLLKMYEGWSDKRKSLLIDMQGEELQQYFHYLHEELKVPFKGGLEQKRRVQHLAYFSHGLIGMASPDPQPAETMQLLERFAAVFNLTFARFNDLKMAEAHALQAEQDLAAIKEAKQKAEAALTELQATQKQLIQAEKMASLGELTAGIAHEIQNPLNFVNNFSEISRELIDELKSQKSKLKSEEQDALLDDIDSNLEKIHHHGKRADAIVKGMLQHSSSGSGKKEPTDINALTDEYLRLAYHGLRAKDKTFNATIKTDFDASVGKIPVIPQDIGRVVLNLINNAFYACTLRPPKRGVMNSVESHIPTVWVSTKREANNVFISVKDNGPGIPPKILDKIFQPFFTTKPTGQGTGLGLSLSYDIVKAHGGALEVETEEGEGTEFIVRLPAN